MSYLWCGHIQQASRVVVLWGQWWAASMFLLMILGGITVEKDCYWLDGWTAYCDRAWLSYPKGSQSWVSKQKKGGKKLDK